MVVECGMGSYSPDGFYPCEPCYIGTYGLDIGSTDCTPCPDGKTTTNIGSYDLTDCRGKNDGLSLFTYPYVNTRK